MLLMELITDNITSLLVSGKEFSKFVRQQILLVLDSTLHHIPFQSIVFQIFTCNILRAYFVVTCIYIYKYYKDIIEI